MTNVIGLGKALVGDGGTDVLPVLSLLQENSDWWIELCDKCDWIGQGIGRRWGTDVLPVLSLLTSRRQRLVDRTV